MSALSRLDLPGVGVAGDHHGRHLTAPAAATLDLPPGRKPGDVPLQAPDPRPQPPAVGFQLGLARAAGPDPAAARHPAAGLPGQRLAPAAQPGQHVLQLGQLDLRLAFAAAGVLGEDVQDQRGPVDDLDLHHALQPPELAGGKLAVADHRVGAHRGDDAGQLAGLARADVGRGVNTAAPLDQAVEHLGPRGFGQPAQLAQRILRAGQAAFGPHPDQHDPLEPQRTVLDLADVLQFGGEPGDPAQRVPLFQVHVSGQIWRVRLLADDRAHCPPLLVPRIVPRPARDFILLTPGPGHICPAVPSSRRIFLCRTGRGLHRPVNLLAVRGVFGTWRAWGFGPGLSYAGSARRWLRLAG